MSTTNNATSPGKSFSLALDTWAVIVALLVALAVRLDILKNVAW